jgi:hypothetical protein
LSYGRAIKRARQMMGVDGNCLGERGCLTQPRCNRVVKRAGIAGFEQLQRRFPTNTAPAIRPVLSRLTFLEAKASAKLTNTPFLPLHQAAQAAIRRPFPWYRNRSRRGGRIEIGLCRRRIIVTTTARAGARTARQTPLILTQNIRVFKVCTDSCVLLDLLRRHHVSGSWRVPRHRLLHHGHPAVGRGRPPSVHSWLWWVSIGRGWASIRSAPVRSAHATRSWWWAIRVSGRLAHAPWAWRPAVHATWRRTLRVLQFVEAGSGQGVGPGSGVHGAAVDGTVTVGREAEERVIHDVLVAGRDGVHELLTTTISPKARAEPAARPFRFLLGVLAELRRVGARRFAILPGCDAHHVEVVRVDHGHSGWRNGGVEVIIVLVIVVETVWACSRG